MHANRFRADGLSELVTILVGPSKTKFTVHKKLACEASPVLNAAFNSSFVEGQTQEYALTDTTEGAVSLFTEWMYTGNIVLVLPQDANDPKVPTTQGDLLGLWILADKLLVPRLQNRALLLFEGSRVKHNHIHMGQLMNAWTNTGDGCGLRRYLTNIIVRLLPKEVYKKHQQYFTKDMLLDVAFLVKDILDVGGKISQFPAIETFYVEVD
ncbi:hypothetical protein IFR04_014175 [Cadophora malorum]|uniref:BTB domain-containing protein n=1 Tax=Cadophora malorum TaxID=108018 RepID=A0A8H7T3S8_9HELO|nr:hypothetical protein IFR04_014175 [Cadophora malorum]